MLVQNMKTGVKDDLRAIFNEDPRLRGNISSGLINSYLDDDFFDKYNCGEEGSLKIYFFHALAIRYGYPHPVNTEDILYLIKELADE